MRGVGAPVRRWRNAAPAAPRGAISRRRRRPSCRRHRHAPPSVASPRPKQRSGEARRGAAPESDCRRLGRAPSADGGATSLRAPAAPPGSQADASPQMSPTCEAIVNAAEHGNHLNYLIAPCHRYEETSM
ncbi:uncharacterized protein LOC126204091 [Schistocerca nitens]|uniref:uncharacterized protein LOC126204091 n=1 Tax=Schistocerca nitens TaxID=7011 RepID=UPI002117D762|nr:uncharacterized protein LOC126204091 [Schistocerca nitens]